MESKSDCQNDPLNPLPPPTRPFHNCNFNWFIHYTDQKKFMKIFQYERIVRGKTENILINPLIIKHSTKQFDQLKLHNH